MSFSFSSIGHAIATGLSDVVKGEQAVQKFLAKIDTPANQATVEAITALIPNYGSAGVLVERGVFAVAGEVASLLKDFDAASVEKLVNAGLDKTVLTDFQNILKSTPSLFAGVSTVAKV
jgi:hypothetical protein